MKKININYFTNTVKPYVVTPEDLDMIIQHSMDNRSLIISKIKFNYEWNTDMNYAHAFVEEYKREGDMLIDIMLLNTILEYMAENREVIELIGDTKDE